MSYACLTLSRMFISLCDCVLPGFLWSVCSRPGGETASFPQSVYRALMPCPDKTSTLCTINHSRGRNITATTSVFLEASQLDNLSLGLLVSLRFIHWTLGRSVTAEVFPQYKHGLTKEQYYKATK